MSLPQEVYADLKAQLPALTKAIKEGAEWGTDLAHRFIIYDLVLNGLLFVICGGLLFWFLWNVKRWNRWIIDNSSTDNPVFFLWFTYLLTIPCANYLFKAFEIIVRDIFIPEVRILEILRGLIN